MPAFGCSAAFAVSFASAADLGMSVNQIESSGTTERLALSSKAFTCERAGGGRCGRARMRCARARRAAATISR